VERRTGAALGIGVLSLVALSRRTGHRYSRGPVFLGSRITGDLPARLKPEELQKSTDLPPQRVFGAEPIPIRLPSPRATCGSHTPLAQLRHMRLVTSST
jgi:hypothetical protein